MTSRKTPTEQPGKTSPRSKMLYATPAQAVAACALAGGRWTTISLPRNYGAASQVRHRIKRGLISSWQQFLGSIEVRMVPDPDPDAPSQFGYVVQICSADGVDLNKEFDFSGIEAKLMADGAGVHWTPKPKDD